MAQEFFESLIRELGQCSTGDGVESILTSSSTDPSRNVRVDMATFILLPPAGTRKPLACNLPFDPHALTPVC